MDRAVAPTTTLPDPGDRFGPFEILLEIARGGMAVVFLARRGPAPNGVVRALKVILPELAADRDFVDMFLDEARICAAIHHPNVIQVYELGEQNGLPFITMEYVEGQTLDRIGLVDGGEPREVPNGVLLAILAQAAEGLHAAHETRDFDGGLLGVVHRDVSPDNILVGYDGIARVVDFGIARARGRRTQTHTGQIKGKLRYLAPEQVMRNVELDRRVDVWGLGVVAFELLSGEALFKAETETKTLWNVVHQAVPYLKPIRPDLPDSLTAILQACLERDPAARPPTCLAIARELRAAARAFGGDSNADIGHYVKTVFAADVHAEKTRVESALVGVLMLPDRGEPPPGTAVTVRPGPVVDDESPLAARDSLAPPPKRGLRWAVVLLVILIAAGGGAAAAYYGGLLGDVDLPWDAPAGDR
jgi:serine/threonine protein kinase